MWLEEKVEGSRNQRMKLDRKGAFGNGCRARPLNMPSGWGLRSGLG